jgi:hypothetical protein
LKLPIAGIPMANPLVGPVADPADPIDRQLAQVVPTIDLSRCYRKPEVRVDYLASWVCPMALLPAVAPRDLQVTVMGQHPMAVVRL